MTTDPFCKTDRGRAGPGVSRGRLVCAVALRASLHNLRLCKADRRPGAAARRDDAPGRREAEGGGRQGLRRIINLLN